MEDKYDELVQRAEKAVAGVKDPELRRVAFEKILDDLLGSGSSLTGPAIRKAKVARVAPAGKRKGLSQGPKAYIKELIDEGYFKKQKTMAEVKAELENRGHHIPFTSLSGPLQKLCQEHHLRRQRTSAKGKKQTFAYSNW